MEIYKVYTIGEKLRLFREKYRLRQEQIVGNDVTRNLISQIENGKAGLTRSTAQIILSHAKEILERDNIHLDVDIEYLLEDEKTQARKILDNFIYELKQLANTNDNAFADTLNEAEKFMLKWDYTDKKIAIYDIAGDYYFKNRLCFKRMLIKAFFV
ncbi:helix-turn-helix transcriptional regulator [Clostridium sp. 19966]|uniref:helix-turn-helix domain-containing protein n=1 Tax=Clostridium sp. 19966 TaxID=2768166 RepID=UPI0028DF1D77|nr:helix-turn-helix transcriptional regulator [Clostridium sp. 19966]MDT8719226.1 helix-turn-helix transcriptional regulator [Clostridium sp. 19966]